MINIQLTKDLERAYLVREPDMALGMAALLNAHAFEQGHMRQGDWEPVLLTTGQEAGTAFLKDEEGHRWYIQDPSIR
jgi:hypothetical protein